MSRIKKNPPKGKTRKEVRKQKRLEKKKIKYDFLKKKRNLKRNVTHRELKKSTDMLSLSKVKTANNCPIKDPMERFKKLSDKNKKKVQTISSDSRKRDIDHLKMENEKEDLLIKQLEKKLKLDNKRGQKIVPKCFNDGFDYILELCLPNNVDKMCETSKKDQDQLTSCSGMLAMTSGRHQFVNVQKPLEFRDNEVEFTGLGLEDDMGSSGSTNENAEISEVVMWNEKNESTESESDDEVNEKSHRYVRAPEYKDDNPENKDLFEGGRDEMSAKVSADEVVINNDVENSALDENNCKDIYERMTNKEVKIIPSQLQDKASESQERQNKLQRLRKQLKGWLNRLAEANLSTIIEQTEKLYMKNSRHEMTHTLCTLILESIITPVAAVERMVMEHALYITIIHANIGIEVGAHFLEALVERFDTMLNQIKSYDVENKELDNVVLFISHLYTFRVCNHNLIFDILKRVSVELSEKCIECILVILRSVGYALRKDDPDALKTFIRDIRTKADTLSESLKKNTRMNFMVNILLAVKNNNIQQIPNYDLSLAEHLRKLLKGILNTSKKYVITLNVTMNDLLSTDEKGKWWTGRQSERQENNSSSSDHQKFSTHLLNLAKQHGMNTEDKRNVFCSLMKARDQTDAFNLLIELSLKDNRIIPSILIYCCISESVYNAFYAVVAEKLCFFDRKYRLAVLFASWDRIKVLNNLSETQIENFSKFLAYLIEEGAQSLSILKVVDYVNINKASIKLVRRIMLSILLKDDYTCRKVFQKISSSNHLSSFRVRLKLFLQQFLFKKTYKLDLTQLQLKLIKNRIAIADEALSSNSKILL